MADGYISHILMSEWSSWKCHGNALNF